MTMLRFVSVVLLGVFAGSAMATQSKNYHFKVFLDDKEIGHHRYVVSPHQTKTYVSSEANFDVKFLFLSVYTYLHDNNEIWRGDCLHAIHSTTDDNGEMFYVRGESNQQQLSLQTSSSQQQLEGCIRTFAYWDPQLLNSEQLLNAQTGELVPVDIQPLGESAINVRGEQVQAQRYRINNHKFSIDVWYSANQEWLALESTTENGATLRYQIQ